MRLPADAVRRALPLVAALGTVAALAHPTATLAVGMGRWTPKFDWATIAESDRRTAVHMMLLRGDGAPYHSRVLWFGGEPHNVFKGGTWGWNPNTTIDDCNAYPTANFTAITPLPTAGYNIFCSGHAALADGRMLVAGGHSHETGAFGVSNATIHTAGTGEEGIGSWTEVSSMAARRWYPTNTTLKDGRVLVTAGFQHRQHRIFGGRLGGAAPSTGAGDTVRRWAPVPPVEGGGWDPPVLPLEDVPPAPPKPAPREGHTGLDLTGIDGFDNQTLIFGGKGSTGLALGDLWALKREDNTTGTDYQYRWEHKSPSGTEIPVGRSEHSAIVARDKVAIFGGRETNGTPLDDLFLYTPGAEGAWQRVFVDSGAPPSPRMGHVAIYNEMAMREHDVDKYVKRMIVYGGAATATEGSLPSDTVVYEFRFNPDDPARGYWKAMEESTFAFAGKVNGPALQKPPGRRYWHRAAAGADSVNLAGGAPLADLAYVFGGALGNGNYSDSLWILCLFASGKYGWIYRDVDVSSGPSPRARFSMAFDPSQGEGHGPRLYVHGGEGAGGPLADKGIYIVDAGLFAPDPAWENWGEAGYTATGHVAVCERRETHSRIAEIFTPSGSGGTWTTLTGTLLQLSYPVTFTVSGGSSGGGRVVTASSWDAVTRYSDLPGPGSTTMSWQPFAGSGLGFTATTGVLYRPDKIMVAGGAFGQTVVGTTRTLDASIPTNTWQNSANMLSRYYHNLVLLPDGKVLATGGATSIENYNANPVFQPQIWDPNGGGGTGTWTAPGALASSTAVRGYHSTSILLPDGRVLCAGGWGNPYHADQLKADIYCPPYLFNADNSLASRPLILSWPETVTYGERFTVCLDTDSVSAGSFALLRPAMTTHSFDQNQRYLPLTWSLASTTPGVKCTYELNAPWNTSQAPPGDYLLFAVNATGTPGIAKWVRLVAPSPDTDHPEMVTSVQKVCSYGESIELKWNPPREDSVASSCPGPVHSYQLRYKTSSMASWQDFATGSLAETPSLPGHPGSANWDHATVTNLTANTRYYFRLVSKDYAAVNANWSAMSPQASFITHYEECGEFSGGGGGGGGGSSAQRVAGQSGLRRGTGDAGTDGLGNTLLANVPAGQSRTDRLYLPAGPEWVAGVARVKLTRTGTRGTHVEGVRLLAVDHPIGTEVFKRGDDLVTGSVTGAVSVAHADGRNLLTTLAEDGGFAGTEEDTVVASLGSVGPGVVVLSTEGSHLVLPPSETGIEVQSFANGAWVTVGRHHPRARGSTEAFEVPDVSAVRLLFHGQHRLLGMARFEGAKATATTHAPSVVNHSESGPGLAALATDGLTLDPAETLVADFVTAPAPAGVERSWFLEVTGSHTAATGGGVSSNVARPQVPAAPVRFALRQNQPNPLAAATTIGFDLPARSHVEVVVFDLLGRRVAVLADHEYEPGRHQLEWSRSDLRGRTVRPGVYIYRLIAGSQRAQKSMVVIP